MGVRGPSRMKLQDNVGAVVVKEVQLRDPVTRSLRVRCTAAPAPARRPPHSHWGGPYDRFEKKA